MRNITGHKAVIGALLLAATAGAGLPAAARQQGDPAPGRIVVAAVDPGDLAAAAQTAAERMDGRRRIWCVPYARDVSGIEIKGNAATWWRGAGDDYPRGRKPVVGAVLNFRASGAMPLGHVAVVSGVISAREIEVTQANWTRNRITSDRVVDVSKDNDWSAVRVENTTGYGRINPTYGFIYRPAQG
ncbi:CHAP domain-containing protein [Frigidibacter sp. MR17.14]|uniref:CHAP domain-containing protein n=1 Tax=Frigidibacter sp. MR17.14 TaxID=3126509 RepID=UPI003012B8DD